MQSCSAIRAGVAEALTARVSARPLVWPTPLRVTLRSQTPAMADLFCQWSTFERVAPVELRFAAPSIEAAVRMLNCCAAMSAMLR